MSRGLHARLCHASLVLLCHTHMATTNVRDSSRLGSVILLCWWTRWIRRRRSIQYSIIDWAIRAGHLGLVINEIQPIAWPRSYQHSAIDESFPSLLSFPHNIKSFWFTHTSDYSAMHCLLPAIPINYRDCLCSYKPIATRSDPVRGRPTNRLHSCYEIIYVS